jgi:hypothetical protein
MIDQPATVDELASLLMKSERLFDPDYTITPETLRQAAKSHSWVILNLSLSVHNLLEAADKMEKDNPPPPGEKEEIK